ncbi:MAG: hypothetical protein AAFY28_18745, partial [Actinomycetota bacterium]
DGDPVTTRITSTEVSLRLDEPNHLTDGVHAPEPVTVVALREGVWDIGDGRRLEVATVAGLSAANGFVRVDFSSAFASAPVVVAQVQTANGSDWTIARLDEVTATGFELRLQNEEAVGRTDTEQVVGWLALEAGAFDWGGLAAQAFTTPRSVDEERSADDETGHVDERAAGLAFETEGLLTGDLFI